jgi:hypothetical protein
VTQYSATPTFNFCALEYWVARPSRAMTAEGFVIASQRVGAKRRPMTGSAKQSSAAQEDWIASSLRSSQ